MHGAPGLAMPRTPQPRIPIPQAAASCTGFAAFAVAIIVGLWSSNPTDVVIGRALVSMLVGAAGGFAVGLVCDWLVNQEVARIAASMEVADHDGESANEREDGLTGVDVLEDGNDSFASARVESENREAGRYPA
jgi:hypothetical protein